MQKDGRRSKMMMNGEGDRRHNTTNAIVVQDVHQALRMIYSIAPSLLQSDRKMEGEHGMTRHDHFTSSSTSSSTSITNAHQHNRLRIDSSSMIRKESGKTQTQNSKDNLELTHHEILPPLLRDRTTGTTLHNNRRGRRRNDTLRGLERIEGGLGADFELGLIRGTGINTMEDGTKKTNSLLSTFLSHPQQQSDQKEMRHKAQVDHRYKQIYAQYGLDTRSKFRHYQPIQLKSVTPQQPKQSQPKTKQPHMKHQNVHSAQAVSTRSILRTSQLRSSSSPFNTMSDTKQIGGVGSCILIIDDHVPNSLYNAVNRIK